MNVLILGSGAREHALCAAVAKSPLLDKLFAAPGNPGCEQFAKAVELATQDHAAIIEFCRQERIEFVIVGPEAPLVAGIVDDLGHAGIAAFGPTRAAARLEGSKGFTKDFCREHAIPTAEFQRFRSRDLARQYVVERGAPIVVKADGLASGKGVMVAMSAGEALAAVDSLYADDPNAECVVEAYLEGEEVSFFALCDGARAVSFGDAQDHKRVGEGDTGPNTGGMGAYSPSQLLNQSLTDQIMSEIVRPTLEGMKSLGTPFVGFLFAGLMLTASGPKLIEYNVRFGDPEAEVILMRLEDDLLRWLWDASQGRLERSAASFRSESALTVVMAARGYPGAPEKGGEISGIETASARPGVAVFHAGTRRDNGRLVANGGRVLAVTGMGRDIAEARSVSYAAVAAIDFPTGFYRRDIGFRALKRGAASTG